MKKSDSCQTLVDAFPAARRSGKLSGWKRSLTLYCQRKSQETGTEPVRFRAAVKMRLTKSGFDCSTL